MYKKTVFIFFILLSFQSNSQTNENYSTVYDYLYRIAQKGIISFQDYILPLDRTEIKRALDSTKFYSTQLSKIEKIELDFFLQEYYSDNLINYTNTENKLIRKDKENRLRTFHFTSNQTKIYFDPIVGANYSRHKNGYQFTSFGGARLYGYLNNRIGFNLFFRDITEIGDSLDLNKNFSREGGVVNTSRDPKQLNYSQLNFNIGYRWGNSLITIGKDQLNWGYGLGGKIILSSKAPSFPYIKLDYKLNKWLRFNYFNAWLNSNLIDSSRSYNTYTGVAGGYREVYRSKFLAQHSISIIPLKGLDIAVGESMVYSDKLDIGYLIPINLFKLYDQYASGYNINGGGNSQLFAQISSRNQLKNTHLYFSVFIDEVRFGKILDKVESRNQFAYTFGINKTDFLVPYFSVGFEYTRINPFVYTNLIPAQTYQNAGYSLGDWMGNNADRIRVFANYTPLPRVKLKLFYEVVRKGSAGTIDQQYNQQPQPVFLFGQVLNEKNISLQIAYEYLHKLQLYASLDYLNQNYINPIFSSRILSSLNVGFSYGL